MKREWLICCVLLMIQCALALAQDAPAQARKFDEFGDIQTSDLKARLDNFAIELQNSPTALGFIMVYRSRRDLPGLNSRVASIIKEYLVSTRGLAAERIITVDGGESMCLVQELWIIPPGTAPKPRADAYQRDFVDTDSNRKFDEFHYFLPEDVQEADDPDYVSQRGSLEAYAKVLLQAPRAQAYIIVYPQYYIERWPETDDRGRTTMHTRVHLDRRDAAARISREIKAELVKTHHIAPSRIRIVNGGYRNLRQLELWVVPQPEFPPIATPNAFPQKRRAR